MKSKNKKNTVWIVFTCIFALTTVVLAMALYRSHSTLEAMRVQLAEGQTNTITAETNQSRQQLAGAHNMQAVRVMNGILQQQDENEQWVDVAPVADLQQADPVIRTAETPIVEVRAMTPQIAETVRISDGRMKCCRRDGRNLLL